MNKQPPAQECAHEREHVPDQESHEQEASRSVVRKWRKIDREKAALYDSGCLRKQLARIAGEEEVALPASEEVEVVSKPRTRPLPIRRS